MCINFVSRLSTTPQPSFLFSTLSDVTAPSQNCPLKTFAGPQTTEPFDSIHCWLYLSQVIVCVSLHVLRSSLASSLPHSHVDALWAHALDLFFGFPHRAEEYRAFLTADIQCRLRIMYNFTTALSPSFENLLSYLYLSFRYWETILF